MVLIRRYAVLGLVMLVGCNQSLFDAHGAVSTGADGGAGNDAPGSGIVVPTTCPAPCIADAAGDFDGSAGGKTNHWRYLEDHRDRTWSAMSAGTMAMTGADQANHITTCTAKSGAVACGVLPGALLMSSAGATSPADPAIELTATKAQVIQLSLRAYVAGGDDQTIRIYRNSREDALYTGVALARTTLDQAITLDALAGDRFVVALAPTTNGATDVALQVFVNPTGAVFPASCQVAVPFAAAAGNTVDNLCGGDFTHALYDGNKDTAPVLAAGPYPELAHAGDFTSDNYFHGTTVLDKTHDTTVQFWVKQRAFVDTYDAWLFSDLDINSVEGVTIGIINLDPPTLEVDACGTGPDCFRSVAYPAGGGWQFVRVVHTNGNVNICLNGVRKASFPLAAGRMQSTFPPNLGNNQNFSPNGAFFDGELADVRVITGALPCDL